MAEDPVVVTELRIFPIKACGGIAVPAARVTAKGLASPNLILRDRTFVVVRATNGKFLTQRQIPGMALIRTRVEPESALRAEEPAEGAELVVSAPKMSTELRIPLTEAGNTAKPHINVTVWDWSGVALEESEKAAAWFSELLGTPAKLARFATNVAHRPANPEFAPPQHEIAFADQFPFLLGNEVSMADLNERIDGEVLLIDRFRPNIVVKGAGAWDEDQWARVEMGGALFLNAKPCTRCKVPSIDQATAEESAEPLRTMNVMRSGKALGWVDPPSFKISVFFGINLCCVAGEGALLRCGDAANVLERKDV